MERDIDRRTFLTGVGAVATTAVAGCSGGSSGGGTDTEPDSDTGEGGTDGSAETSSGTGTGESGGDLQMMMNPVDTLDPIGITGTRDEWASWQIHESLFTYEEGTPPVVGDLATDYSLSDDYRTYTFTLKEGVSFHDGSELTASDVVYSWQRLAYAENSRGNQDHILRILGVAHESTEDGGVEPGSMELAAVDDYTVEVTLERPFHGAIGWLTDPTFAVIPEGVVGDIPGYEGEMSYEEWATEAVTGTGHMQLESWEQGSEIVLSRFDDYHGSTANLDGIRFQIVGDPNARYTRAVNEGNADVFTIPRSQFDPSLLEREEELDDGRTLGSYGPVSGTTLNYGETSIPRTQFLQCNVTNVETAARKALAYAINQEAIVEQATKGLGQPAYFVTPPRGFPGGPERYYELAESDYPYGFAESDIESARAVMEEAGYGPDNMYETALQHPSDNQVSQWEAVASYIRDLAQSVHIDLSVEPAPSSTLVNRAIEGSIDIFCNYIGLTWLEADSALQYTHPTPNTWTRWGEAGMTDAAQQASDAWDTYLENRVPTDDAQATRDEMYLQIERSNWEDVPLVPLWVPTDQVYWYDRVEDYRINGPLRRTKLNEASLGE